MKRSLLIILLLSQICTAQVRTFSGKPLSAAVLENRIKKAMDSLKVPGMALAIINQGKVVFNEGFGYANVSTGRKVSTSSFFEAASMSKPVFAAYVLTLARQHKIDLDTPLYVYLPSADIDDERYKTITARMILSHSSGLPNWRESDKMKLAFDPGQGFSYSGEGYVYLAKVIAKLSGHSLKSLDADFQQTIARPWGLSNFHFVLSAEVAKNEVSGYQGTEMVRDERDRLSFDPAGGMYASSGNYARFLIRLMDKQGSYPELFNPVVNLDTGDVVRKYFGVTDWTSGMGVIKIGNSVNFWHGGNNLGYTNSFLINPEQKFGYVFLSNADQCHGLKKVIEEMLWQ